MAGGVRVAEGVGDGLQSRQAEEVGKVATFCPSPAIANAIDDAAGERLMEMPLDAEAICRALLMPNRLANPTCNAGSTSPKKQDMCPGTAVAAA
jgi:hypothetical protein